MPLSGITVVDVGTAVAGPYCATLLGELGARVIKVEKPKRGDLIRYTDRYVRGHSGYFLGVNRGKESVTIDVRTPEGQEILKRLIAEADVLVENFRPGMMNKWGLGYEALSAINPRLVYCSMTAFPETKGFETAAGNDITVQAFSGVMDLTGYPEEPPAKVGAPLVDSATAMLGALGAVAAIRRRDTTGRGEHVKVSLLESAYALMPNFIVTELNSDKRFGRLGTGHPQLVPYQAFLCSDGKYIVVGAFHRESWEKLMHCIERPDLIVDQRFAENFNRIENRDQLIPLVQGEMLKRSREEWSALFEAAGVPCSPIFSLRESLDYFTGLQPSLLQEAVHEKLGPIRMLRSPMRYQDEMPAPQLRAAPELGTETARELGRLGYSNDEIAKLRDAEII